MKTVSVYWIDSFDYIVEMNPELWECAQRRITEDEHRRIEALLIEYRALQAMLKEIAARPEWDGVEGKFVEE